MKRALRNTITIITLLVYVAFPVVASSNVVEQDNHVSQAHEGLSSTLKLCTETSGTAVFPSGDITLSIHSAGGIGLQITDGTIPKSDIVFSSNNTSLVKVHATAIRNYERYDFSYSLVYITTGTKTGSTILTAHSKSGRFEDVSITLNVEDRLDYLELAFRRAPVCDEYGWPRNRLYLHSGQSVSMKPFANGKSHWDKVMSIHAKEYPIKATRCRWISSNKKVATVSKTGKVTMKRGAKEGAKATITATVKGTKIKAKYTVIATWKHGRLKGLFLNESYDTGDVIYPEVSDQFLLEGTYHWTGKAYGIRTWKSSKPSVASITKEGYIRAKKVGKTIITLKCGNKTARCTLEVQKTGSDAQRILEFDVSY